MTNFKNYSSLVSVVVPLYNSENFIGETISSLLQQNYNNWELIIVDDGSTDKSLEVVNSFKDERIKLHIRSTASRGGSVCRNIGIEKANGNYLIFLDSDDLLGENCLTNRVRVMESDFSLDFAVFNTQTFYKKPGDSQVSAVDFSIKNPIEGFLEIKYPYPWHTMSPIWRRSFLESFGGFSENYPRLQDPEFHSRVLLQENINYSILHQMPPDSFYRISTIKDRINLSEKYLISLKLYLHDISILINNKPRQELYKKNMRKAVFRATMLIFPNRKLYDKFYELMHVAINFGIINRADTYLLKLFFTMRLYIYNTFHPTWNFLKNAVKVSGFQSKLSDF